MQIHYFFLERSILYISIDIQKYKRKTKNDGSANNTEILWMESENTGFQKKSK